ncbi:hypothetical protein ACFS5M_01970 [Lacinutrix iliipiscaria]|uniref:Uncharacterized protein n=1 Tax=Lacinutrix iliipiscaria TaxID=1230532 RepID=A0ABW5WMM7_9FLAO
MKYIFIIASLLLTTLVWAQDSSPIEKVETPRIVSKLYFGEQLKFNDIELKFVDVLQDSRCPKNVNCIWAGEVVVLVDVFKNGNKTTQKKVTLSPKSHLQDLTGNLFSSEDLSISGFNILPYPVSGTKTKIEDYYIQLDIRN